MAGSRRGATALDHAPVWQYGLGMAATTTKATFTFDDATIRRLRETADRLGRPQSQVVREAIADYAERVGRLSEEERRRWLEIFDTVVPTIPLRPVNEVDEELRELRAA